MSVELLGRSLTFRAPKSHITELITTRPAAARPKRQMDGTGHESGPLLASEVQRDTVLESRLGVGESGANKSSAKTRLVQLSTPYRHWCSGVLCAQWLVTGHDEWSRALNRQDKAQHWATHSRDCHTVGFGPWSTGCVWRYVPFEIHTLPSASRQTDQTQLDSPVACGLWRAVASLAGKTATFPEQLSNLLHIAADQTQQFPRYSTTGPH